jgi:hypothetical protein
MEIAHATCLKATDVPGKSLVVVWSELKGLCLALRNGSIRGRKPYCCQQNLILIITDNVLHVITIRALDNTSFVRFAWRDSLQDPRSNIVCHLAAYSCLSVDHAWLSRSGRYNTNHSDDLTRCSASLTFYVAFCIPIQISMADCGDLALLPEGPVWFQDDLRLALPTTAGHSGNVDPLSCEHGYSTYCLNSL